MFIDSVSIFSVRVKGKTPKRLDAALAGPQHPPLSALVPCATGNAVLVLDLEVFIKTVFSGQLFLESEEVFLINIMLPALRHCYQYDSEGK